MTKTCIKCRLALRPQRVRFWGVVAYVLLWLRTPHAVWMWAILRMSAATCWVCPIEEAEAERAQARLTERDMRFPPEETR